MRAWVAEALPTFDAAQAAAQLSGHIAEGSAALREVAAQLAEQQASLKRAAGNAFTHLSEQSALCATCAVNGMKEAAAQLAEQQAAFMLFAGQKAAQLAAREAEMKQSAALAAARLAESFPGSPAVLKAAASRLREQHATIQVAASNAIAQLTNWQMQVKNAASQTAAQFAEGVAEGQAVLVEAATQAAGRVSEPQVALRRAVAAVGTHLSEGQSALAQAASSTASQLTRSAANGQEALWQAATAAELLHEHEKLLRQSSTLILGLAEMQATLSPSAGRVSAQLAELQRQLNQATPELAAMHAAECSPGDAKDVLAAPQHSPEPEPKPFAYGFVLDIKARVQDAGLEVVIASAFFCVVGLCLCSTVLTIKSGGGEDPESLGYDRLLRRAACWFFHRLCLGWGLVLLSDIMEAPPFHIQKYDTMGWPRWATLLPTSSQFVFFIPAAAVLNTAVAQRSRTRYGTPATRRFYAGLSREVHASIVGCFVSDWCLFPTDMIFFFHHLLGLGIIFGVWAMVLREARSLSSNATDARTTINFWWVTGLSIATMEASSFLYCLYSLMSFGDVLNLSLFAVFTYSNVLSIMCVIAVHPWGTGMKVIWFAGGQLSEAIEGAQTALPRFPLPGWLSSKATQVSMSYILKSLMVAVICLARQSQMWANVGERTPTSAIIVVGTLCVLLAGGCVWRLRDFEAQPAF